MEVQMSNYQGNLFSPQLIATELRTDLFSATKDGETICSGKIGFALAGTYARFDSEFVQTKQGGVFVHNELFRGLVGKEVRVLRDRSNRHGFRVEMKGVAL